MLYKDINSVHQHCHSILVSVEICKQLLLLSKKNSEKCSMEIFNMIKEKHLHLMMVDKFI